MSALMTHLKHFISTNAAIDELNDCEEAMRLAIFYKRNQLDEQYFQNAIKKAQSLLRKEGKQDAVYYYNEYKLAQIIYTFQSSRNNRAGDLNLTQVLEYLDYFYLLSKFEYSGLTLMQNKYSNFQWTEIIPVETCLQPIVRKNNYFGHTQIALNSLSIDMVNGYTDSHSAFFEFVRLLDSNIHELPEGMRKNLAAFARNYCTQQYNSGDDSFLPILFQMYQDHLKLGLLFHEGGVHFSTLINIGNTGLRLKAFDWVKGFFEAYKDKIIGTPFPNDYYQFCMANYHLHVQAYDKAMGLVNSGFQDPYIELSARRLEIKIYYEIEEMSLLDAKINNFGRTLSYFKTEKNQSVPASILQMNNAFLNVLRRILLPKTLGNPKRIAKLRQYFEKLPSVAEREWLQEKLAELK
ncbi:MAG TPA: hypothetical protein PKA70_21865 [Saprospiraceae bacterium]|nr:hypothetical protein [Saprospiraceae bacterium]